jgi:hypothetical protein
MVKYQHMNKNALIGTTLGLTLGLILSTPELVFAQPVYDLNGEPPKLGAYLPELLKNIWKFFQRIFVAISLIMGMYLAFQTFTNRENSKALEEMPSKWMYMVAFVFLAFGAGGTILNFILRVFGFGNIDTWLGPLNKLFTSWTNMASGF